MFKFNKLLVAGCSRNWYPTTVVINVNQQQVLHIRHTPTLSSNLFTPCDTESRRFFSMKRTFSSLKVKQEQQTQPEDEISASAVDGTFIELDEKRFTNIAQDGAKSSIGQQPDNKWKPVPDLTITSTLGHYSKLGKIKLTGLVVLTTLGGAYMGTVGSMDYALLGSVLAGTALTSCSAAAFNHFLEVPFDSQMRRTQDRPLVQGLVTPLHAVSFAAASGIAGVTLLATCVNPLTAALGAINLGLYSFIYTPMKRVHIVNTWIGAIVGAIPPVMGFTAVTGVIDLPSALLGLLLYSWQFPHFNALSWNMRHEYARAGYRMMSVTDPKICQNTALRHSLLLLGITGAMCYTDMTHWSFAADSLPFTLYLVYLSYKFRQDPTSKTSRKLFFYTLIYLPVVMFLMAISKTRKSSKEKLQTTVSPAIRS